MRGCPVADDTITVLRSEFVTLQRASDELARIVGEFGDYEFQEMSRQVCEARTQRFKARLAAVADEVRGFAESQAHDRHCSEQPCTCTWRSRTALLDAVADHFTGEAL